MPKTKNIDQDTPVTLDVLTGEGVPLLDMMEDDFVLSELQFGEHRGIVTGMTNEWSKNKNCYYVNVKIQIVDPDNTEPVSRTHSLFEKGLTLFVRNLARQYGIKEAVKSSEILAMAKKKPFSFWVTKKENPKNPTQPYRNWDFYDTTVQA